MSTPTPTNPATPPPNSDGTPTATARQPRWMIRSAGAVLWLLMIPALWIAWQTQIARAQSAATKSKTQSKVTADGEVVLDKAPLPEDGVALTVGTLPPFSLTAHTGATVTRDDLLGEPWVACFVFTRCTYTCPDISLKFRRIQDALPPENKTKLISVTVDPTHDTPEVLAGFAENFGADPDRWLFLTGSPKDVLRLTTVNFGMFARELFGKDRQPGNEVAHTNRVVLVNKEGIPVRSFLAAGPTADTEMVALQRILEGKRPFPKVPMPIKPPEDDAVDKDAGKAASTAINEDDSANRPAWLTSLPLVNASLNTLAAILLIFGFGAIKSGRKRLHKACMLTAFCVSIAFLACYLTHKTGLWQYTGVPSKQFSGAGIAKIVYLAILIPHIILAMVVPIIASITIYKGLRQQWDSHRRWAKLTFPIWLYVSVTGLIIYLMLYHWPATAGA